MGAHIVFLNPELLTRKGLRRSLRGARIARLAVMIPLGRREEVQIRTFKRAVNRQMARVAYSVVLQIAVETAHGLAADFLDHFAKGLQRVHGHLGVEFIGIHLTLIMRQDHFLQRFQRRKSALAALPEVGIGPIAAEAPPFHRRSLPEVFARQFRLLPCAADALQTSVLFQAPLIKQPCMADAEIAFARIPLAAPVAPPHAGI